MNGIDHSPLETWVPTEVHDWEGKESNVLVLNYTMACPLQCDFCCYGCHPKRTEKMPLELALNLVKQAAELQKFSSVGFTGGEPLLYFDELLRIGDKLIPHKLPFTIATAAHWAKTETRAISIISALAERGLYRLNISHDPSHAKFIPRKSIINAAIASSRLGIPTYVVGTFYSKSDSMESYLPEVSGLPKVTLVTKYVSAVGRAANKEITQRTYGLNLGLGDLSCYRRIYHDMVVWYDGTVYPCCSTFNRDTEGIAIGNANIDSLRELWTRLEGSLMFRVMKRQGFLEFYEILTKYDPSLSSRLPSPNNYVGPCSLCNAIFGNPDLAHRVRQVFAAYERDKIEAAVTNLCNLIGGKEVSDFVENVLKS